MGYKKGLVSVVIPSLKHRVKDRKRALESVKMQTYKDIETIVEFGGSNVQDARNIACDRAKGEFIAFLDDDDEFYPTKIEKQVAKMREYPKIDLIITWLDDHRYDYKLIKPIEFINFKFLIQGFNISCTSAFMIRHTKYNEIGKMDTSLVDAHEYDLALRTIHPDGLIYCIQESLGRLNPATGGNWTDDFIRKIHGLFQMRDKWGSHYGLINYIKFVGLIGLFLVGRIWGKPVNKFINKLKERNEA